MIFWMMDMKLMMIKFHILRTNLDLKVILTGQYKNNYGNVVVYTIGRKQALNEMHQILMR